MNAQLQTIAQTQKPSLVAKLAAKYSVDPDKMMATLKATAFKGDVTNEQMMALLIVADLYGLNPWLKEIYAFPDKKNGIVPVVGVDGWVRILNDHPQFNGLEFTQSDEMVTPVSGKPCPEWMEVVLYRKDREHPIRVREYLDEVYQAPRNGYSGPWQSHTKRFLRHKTLIQGARLAFGFSGIFDEDEAGRIVESDMRTIDQSTGEIELLALPDCPQASLDVWVERIKAGKSNADHATSMISSKYTLSDWQRAALNASKPQTGELTEAEKQAAIAREMTEANSEREPGDDE